MRKLIVQQWVTVDNIAAEKDGGLSFVSGEPFSEKTDPAFKASLMGFIDSVDTMLLGANTYLQSKDSWPYAEDQGEYGEKLNNLAKFVASSTLDDAPWGDFPAAAVTRDPVATVRELKVQSGKDIWLWGSLTLMHSLLAAGVVDEVRMLVCPVARGTGTRIFQDRQALKLLEGTAFENGVALLRYEIDASSGRSSGVADGDSLVSRAPAGQDATVSEQPERWTQATVYSDMWVDPDDDPRNSDVSPDGEIATLLDFLANYRLTLRMKCEGLDAKQLAHRSVPPSTMSLLGLLRHLAEVERDWRGWILPGDSVPKLYGEGDADFDGAVADDAVVDAAYADLAREQAATDAALAEHPDASERLAKDGIAVRELWVHRIEEYARHCGHADLLRECIDGRVGQ